jgi:hypothetical protein
MNLFKEAEKSLHDAAEAWNPKGVFSVAGHGNPKNMNDINDQ